MTQPTELTTTSAGRADIVLAEALEISRRRASALLDSGAVRAGKRRVKKGDRLEAGTALTIAGEIALDVVAEALPIDLVFADDHMVAIDKPAGIPTHPLRPGETGTLANRLVARFPECGAAGADVREAGMAHRLDRGTSGVIVAARSRAAWESLRAQFGGGRVDKQYLAVVAGEVSAGSCHERLRTVKGVAVISPFDPNALAASTEWAPERRGSGYTLLRCTAKTGRTHQIRAHLAHSGLPIAGDLDYGGPPAPIAWPEQMLHAVRVALVHPASGDELLIEAPVPEAWASIF